ncbi:MAG: lipopolysaccharide transport periplasmic protein LptA [Candidatus Tectomicrobia bacterium]|jgi:lipopolysaccharide export system protein LptA|nr:lipopolysaccharide transport periplasmic protein LptA [Candidatus Tectomicrobia bacterium]
MNGSQPSAPTRILLCLCLSLLLTAAHAAGPGAEQPSPDETVQVTADRMMSDSRTDRVVFTGNVEARRGDLYVKADRLEVTQDRQSKKMAQMVATGNVFIRKGEQAATAERATFFENEQKAVLTGNPHAWEGSTEVWGEEMVFLLAEGNMVVTGGTQRVRMQLLPPSNEGTKLPATKAKGRGG